MDVELMRSLAQTGKLNKQACGIRLAASIRYADITQQELAQRVGKGAPSINNQVKGLQFPSLDVMAHFYDRYQIDFNFFYKGEFSQLPYNVQEKLFDALSCPN